MGFFEYKLWYAYNVKDILLKIDKKEVFRPLKDIQVFLDTCTVLNDTLAWDIDRNRDNTTCLDIDPDTLYELPAAE